jgi:hypothetical protein
VTTGVFELAVRERTDAVVSHRLEARWMMKRA